MVNLAWLSLAALVLVVVLSCSTTVNPGFVSLALVWIIALYIAPLWGNHFTVGDIVAGFPVDLFLTLVGVTLFFTLVRGNGTLDKVGQVALHVCRGNVGWIPVVFFALSLVIASIGAGNIAAAALVAPVAMAVTERVGISPFLMALMVAHGCIAGALSPIAPTGVIANGLMARMGMSGFETQNYLYNLLANALAAGLGYLVLGGWRLFNRNSDALPVNLALHEAKVGVTLSQWITLATVALFFLGVVGCGVHVGMAAATAAVVLSLARIGDDKRAILEIPWSVIMMVCGVTVLTSLVQKTGGMDLFTTILARFATHRCWRSFHAATKRAAATPGAK